MSGVNQLSLLIFGIGAGVVVLIVFRAFVLWYLGVQKIIDNLDETNRLLKIIAEGNKVESKGDLGVPGLRVNPPDAQPAQRPKSSPYDLQKP